MTTENREQLRSFLVRVRHGERFEDVLHDLELFIEDVAACPFPADQIMLRDYRLLIQKAA